jgi:hypothetical protein
MQKIAWGILWDASIYNGGAVNGTLSKIRMWTIKPKPLERDQ